MAASTDTAGRVWHPAPFQSAPQSTGSIQGVWLFPGEKVEWRWVHLPDGKSYIGGFTLQNAAGEIQPLELPEQVKKSLEALSAFKKSMMDNLWIPKRLLKDDDQKRP